MTWEPPRPPIAAAVRARLLDALGDERSARAWTLRLGLVRAIVARPVLARLFDVGERRASGDPATAARRALERLAPMLPASFEAPSLPDRALAAALDAFPRDARLDDPTALGWLFHELLAHEKAEVFGDARAKIGGARLLPATRLYTPRAIVRFLLENALAPTTPTKLRARLPFVVATQASTPRAGAHPRVLDPACGAGHMLIEALDLLADARLAADDRAPARALARVLDEQLGGIELDRRAADVCALGLRLRACERAGAIVDVAPRIVACDRRLDARSTHGVGVDPRLVEAFARADELGALLPLDDGVDPLFDALGPDGAALRELLAPAWDVVITNPPYVGFRKLDRALSVIVRRDPRVAIDLSVAFLARGLDLLREGGVLAAITPAAWATSSQCEPLRRAMLERGAPRVLVSLGQRVFDDAPLLFVALSLFQRTSEAARDAAREETLVTVRVPTGKGSDELLRAARRGGRSWPLSLVRALPGAPFLPSAPPALLEASARAARGEQPSIGALFEPCDGVWSGSNARDVREAWELPRSAADAWIAASGGQGYARAFAPISRRIRRSIVDGWRGLALRDRLAFEYARVAGGKLSARVAAPGSAAVAGVVTMAARAGVSEARLLEAIAVFDARAGTALLRTLTSGLNFNPGYAARIPLGEDEPEPAFVEAVRALVASKRALAASEPTSDAYDARWHALDDGEHDLVATARARIDAVLAQRARLLDLEADLDARVAARFGVDPDEIDLGDDADVDDDASGALPTESELEALARAHGVSASTLLASDDPRHLDAVDSLRRAAIDEFARTWATTRVMLLFGHPFPNAEEPPEPLRVATLDAGEGSLLAALRRTLADAPAVERSFERATGTTLARFLERELFREHVRRFRRRPALWQLASSPRRPAFACLVHAHRCDGALLEHVARVLVPKAKAGAPEARHPELERFASRLLELARVGAAGAPWTPDPEDGVRVNVAPLQKAGVLACDVLAPDDVEPALADGARWKSERGSALVRVR